MRSVRPRFRLIPLLAVTLVAAAGCSKATPTIDILDSSRVPQPLFAGQTLKSIERASATEQTLLEGECDPRVRSISARAVGRMTQAGGLEAVSSGVPTLSCRADGRFSFTLKSLVDLGYVVVPNQAYVIELRALTAGGESKATVVRVTYTREGWERLRFTAGATESHTGARGASSTNFRAVVRVNHVIGASDAAKESRSTNFRMRLGLAARIDAN